MSQPLTQKQKVQKLMTDIGCGWYMKISDKGIPPLRRPKLSKNHKKSRMRIKKKQYKDNKWWNDWKFQLYWNKLEWVNTKSINKRDKPYSVISKIST